MLFSRIFFISSQIISSLMNYTNNENYIKFLSDYNKSYSLEKYHKFLDSEEFVNNHNQNSEKSYSVSINYFSDKNFDNSMLFIKKAECHNCYSGEDYTNTIPESVDWRTKGAVTHVKNQLECGSCWAFSTTGSIEGALAIHNHNIFNHKIYNLSEQQLVDCSRQNHGCEGGLMDLGFSYVIDNGICSEESYPYIGRQGICNSLSCKKIGHISDYSDVTSNDEKALKRAVAQQPISVAIQANLSSFRFYKNGVYNDPDCGNQLDHGVLIVGYGTDNQYGLDYWIVKNSWSSAWGEEGYVRMLRNYDKNPSGMCGIATQPSFPIY